MEKERGRSRNFVFNLKKNAVKNYADNRRYIRRTGGEPRPPSMITSADAMVHAILGERVTGMPAVCDSDAPPPEISVPVEFQDTDDDFFCPDGIDIKEPKSSEAAKEPIENVVVDCDVPQTTQVEKDERKTPKFRKDWGDYTPAMLKCKTSTALQCKKVTGVVTNKKWCEVADAKMETLALKRKNMEMENERKEELHKTTLRHMEDLHQQKLRHEEEEHKMRMKILEKNLINS